MMLRAFDQKDKLVWLNATAKSASKPQGIEYSNIQGERAVRVSIPNQGNSCTIQIGKLAAEKGKLLERSSTTNNNRPQAVSNTVTGTVTYRERIALPAGAVISVKLLDVSRQDVAAEVISEQKITTTGQQVPIPFKLAFNPAKIQANHFYAVRAEIKIKDKLAFTTTKSYPLITNGHPLEVNLVLQQPQNQQNLESQLMAGEWLLEDLAGTGVIDNLQTTIKFEKEGRLSGSGGCNRYTAPYQLKGNQIKIGMMAATQKACPPAIMNQEDRFFKALAQAYRIRLDKEKGWLFIDCRGLDKPLKFTLIKYSNPK
jgi:putative lipoprotein